MSAVPNALAFSSLALAAEPIVRVIFGQGYARSVPVLQIVCVGLIFATVSSMQTSLMQARGQEHAVAIVNTLAAIVSLGAAGLGAYWGSALGAGVGLGLGYLLQMVGLLLAGRSEVVRTFEEAID